MKNEKIRIVGFHFFEFLIVHFALKDL